MEQKTNSQMWKVNVKEKAATDIWPQKKDLKLNGLLCNFTLNGKLQPWTYEIFGGPIMGQELDPI